MRVCVVMAWPDRCHSVELDLEDGATVADAITASGVAMDGIAGHAVYGVRTDATTPLRDGDRVELLRSLLMDPKDARRKRAQGRTAD